MLERTVQRVLDLASFPHPPLEPSGVRTALEMWLVLGFYPSRCLVLPISSAWWVR
jgi:hypothetical protein